jgi:hypothetical protein
MFLMQIKLHFGCAILPHHLGSERGDLFMGLGCSIGSRGKVAVPVSRMGARKTGNSAAEVIERLKTRTFQAKR